MSDIPDKEEKVVHRHIPKVFALRQPTEEFCEMIITTTARTSHVFSFTKTQMRLLAVQAEKARLNWPEKSKV
jgi:hypothetical protein